MSNILFLITKKFNFKESGFYLILKILLSINNYFKKRLVILSIVMVLNAILEGTSIALIFSFLSILTNLNKSRDNLFIEKLFNNFGVYNIEYILIILTLILTFLFLISGGIRLLNLWLNSTLSEEIGAFISTKIIKNVLNQSYIYHQKETSNKIINAATFCSRSTSGAIDYLLTLITAILLSSSILITILIINFRISSIIILFSVGTYFLIAFLTNKRILKNSKIQLKLSNKQIELIQIPLNSIKDILLNSNQNYFVSNYEKNEKQLRKKFGETKFISLFPKIIIETFVFSSITILAFLIFKQLNSKLFLLPILGTILVSLQKLFPYNQQIFTSWARIKSSKDSINSVFEYMNVKPKVLIKNKDLVDIPFKKAIELKNISFSYPNSNKEVIKNFSTIIKKGQKIGIKGETGKGKSTLINVLMGLIIPNKGEILIDGENLYSNKLHINLASWSSKIAHVPQEISLFNNDFYHNIAFGLPSDEIDMRKVKFASKIACIDEFISSKKFKYKSNVGENGSLLSGGQRQRIAIARAIYKKLDILILDEATSALDYKTERKILNSIFSLDKEMTIIIISHKNDILDLCDEVINL